MHHNAVFQGLSDQGVDRVYIRIIDDSLSESHREFTLFETPTSIKIGRGVKQGDICSSKASPALEDDVVLAAAEPKKFQKLLNELNKGKKIGLSIHDSKTQWMKNAFCFQFTMKLGSENIELMEQYSHLGQIVQMNNDFGLELGRRRRAAGIAFTKLKDIFCDTKITPSVKAELFNFTVVPVLLYGCGTWNTTLAEENKLATTQRAMERWVLVDYTTQTWWRDVVEEMYKRKQRRASHVARMKDNGRTNRIVEQHSRDVKRSHGRSLTRWEDLLGHLYGVAWM
ncbi:unnamed protein product, partial [Toxocara canis]|uniref:Reverse transcriptase domain-containing protein n=1 Tax=Toxocara canis TaxID=6265 RepID=A0A183U7M8_TOXCA